VKVYTFRKNVFINPFYLRYTWGDGMSIVEEVIEVGPRKITRGGTSVAIILGKDFIPLKGRRAIVVLKLLREDHRVS